MDLRLKSINDNLNTALTFIKAWRYIGKVKKNNSCAVDEIVRVKFLTAFAYFTALLYLTESINFSLFLFEKYCNLFE